ncbi:hypothetical protein GCK72_008407 [Caenorhabditis remanei]|uniref:Uncharacterized protein n=1 Tax=Caenorhabditis remanei TaxID=31234 RepID=A0A6A5GZM1_CAERE|nr:hypothetical protein GCK72_008407 [Caenorhabditis remanei]KAF1760161.1 hypothetical protein GCK72_008407 [Caenorhabditis remanei]
MYVGASNIATSKKCSAVNIMDLLCFGLAATTIIVGVTIIYKLSSNSESCQRRMYISGDISERTAQKIMDMSKNNLFSLVKVLDTCRNPRALLLQFKDPSDCCKMVNDISELYTEDGIQASFVMNHLWIRNELITSQDALVSDEEFMRGYQTGESAFVAEALEIVLKRRLESLKLTVYISRLAIDMNVVYNAMILFSTAFTVLYSYLSSEAGSFNALTLYGCLIGLSEVILGLASNWIKGRKCATLALFVKNGQEKEAISLLVGAGIQLFELIQLSDETLVLAHAKNNDLVKYAEKSLQHGMLED